jgi:hypothetical protein
MKLFLILLTVLLIGPTCLAGNGVKGDDPMKDKFILARKQALAVLKSPKSLNYFTAQQIYLMKLKLVRTSTSTDTSDCDGGVYVGKLCWYNTNPRHQKAPLQPELMGQTIETALSTTSDLDSVIKIDVTRAKNLLVSQQLAVVGLLHEAGHAVRLTNEITLSDNLDTDQRVIDLLENFPEILVSKVNNGTSNLASSKTPMDTDVDSMAAWELQKLRNKAETFFKFMEDEQHKIDTIKGSDSYKECVSPGFLMSHLGTTYTKNQCINTDVSLDRSSKIQDTVESEIDHQSYLLWAEEEFIKGTWSVSAGPSNVYFITSPGGTEGRPVRSYPVSDSSRKEEMSLLIYAEKLAGVLKDYQLKIQTMGQYCAASGSSETGSWMKCKIEEIGDLNADLLKKKQDFGISL